MNTKVIAAIIAIACLFVIFWVYEINKKASEISKESEQQPTEQTLPPTEETKPKGNPPEQPEEAQPSEQPSKKNPFEQPQNEAIPSTEQPPSGETPKV